MENHERVFIKEKPELVEILCFCLLYLGNLKLISPQFSMFVNVLQIAVLLVSVICVAKLYTSGALTISANFLIITGFIAIYLLTALYSESDVGKTTVFSAAVSDVTFLVVMYFLCQNADHALLLRTCIIGNSSILLLYLLFNYGVIASHLIQHLRLEDTETNPIWMARYFGDLFICTFMYECYFDKQRKNIIRGSFILLLSAMLLLVMGSKGPIVAVVIAIGCFLLTQKESGVKKAYLFVAAGFALIACIYYVHSRGLESLEGFFRISSMLNDKWGSRLHRYGYTLRWIGYNPILGYGLGSWGLNYIGVDIYDYPHNSLLEIWYETGIVPLLLFISIIISGIVRVKRSESKSAHIFCILMIYYFVNSLFSGGILTGNKYIFFSYILIYSATRDTYNDLNYFTKY